MTLRNGLSSLTGTDADKARLQVLASQRAEIFGMEAEVLAFELEQRELLAQLATARAESRAQQLYNAQLEREIAQYQHLYADVDALA